MKELTMHEMEEVNGGVPILVVAYLVGFDLGLLATCGIVHLAHK